MNRYGVKKSENTTIDLLGIRRVTKRMGGSVLRYTIAHEQEAYAPTVLAAWQGHYTNPGFIAWQRPCETPQEFVKRFESQAIWK